MKWILKCFIAISFFSLEGTTTTEYESLVNSPYTDHVHTFSKLFSIMEVSNFLEFGMGIGTKYFLDNCEKVTSVELTVRERDGTILPWYIKCRGMYKGLTKWKPELFQLSEETNQANNIAWQRKDPEYVSSTAYLDDLREVCDLIFEAESFDVAFVDPGIYLRGDLVCQLFGRVDVILAHDMNGDYRVYNWHKAFHPDYKRIDISYGRGTTVWIKKDCAGLIEKFEATLDKDDL